MTEAQIKLDKEVYDALVRSADHAYLTLLGLPPEQRLSMAVQRTMAQLRDMIAMLTVTDPEIVQNMYEEVAYNARLV